jgi:hypothetical protein
LEAPPAISASFAFAWRQQSLPRKILECTVSFIGISIAIGKCRNGAVDARDNGARVKRFHKIVKGTAFHGFHRRAHVPIAGNNEKGRRIAACIEFLEHRYAGFVGQVQVKQYAGWRASARGGEKGLGIGKNTDTIASQRENDRKRVAHHGDDE